MPRPTGQTINCDHATLAHATLAAAIGGHDAVCARELNRRELLRGAAAAGLAFGLNTLFAQASSGEAPAAPSGRPPNFVVILCDDLHYSDVGCFGSTEVPTPNIDRLAAGGMKLTSFYVSPVCSPTRAMAMTGCYPIRVGIPGNVYGGTGLQAGTLTLPGLLKTRGYATACIGKWMLGNDKGRSLPTRHGFDHFYGLDENNRTTTRLTVGEKRSGSVTQAGMTDAWTRESIRWVTAHKDEPFFLYLPHTAPHYPQVPHERFVGKSRAGNYGDEIVGIDWSTGEVIKTLRDLGLAENTLVVFTSDNGRTTQLTGEKGRPKKPKEHGPLRGQKGSTFEGGVRVPCIAAWPGVIPARTESAAIASIMDLLPTSAGLAGATLPADQPPDGGNILPILRGDEGVASPYEHYFYYSSRDLQAVRRGKWKLFEPRMRGLKQGGDAGALFDLEADLGETRNVASDHPEVVKELASLLADGRARLGDGLQIGSDVRVADPGYQRYKERLQRRRGR